MSIELEKTSSSSSNFPPEIIEIVLSKLPSKSLLRFKTVSKSWNAMISDPVFARIHVESSKNSPNNHFLMYLRSERGLSLVKFEGGKFHSQGLLENPFGSRVHVLCECDGVLLLRKMNEEDDDKDDRYRCIKYALWNPSTRMQMYFEHPYKNLRGEPFHKHSLTHGICYDPVMHDFKVVIIDSIKTYRIYSCKNNSWTEKEGIGVFYGHVIGSGCVMGSGLFVDGAIYWVLSEVKNPYVQIVYFDHRTDELKRLQKPEEISGRNSQLSTKVGSFRGRLCVCRNITGDGDKTDIRFWIKEMGVLENPSWEEFVTIENVLLAPFLRWRLVCFVGNKIVIRLDEKRCVYYSPCEKTIEEVEYWGGLVVPYLHSLLFPFGSSLQPPTTSDRGRKRKLETVGAGVGEFD